MVLSEIPRKKDANDFLMTEEPEDRYNVAQFVEQTVP
jgi:hypothetical protein